MGFVYPKLDEHTAEVIFDGLAAIDGLQLHAEHWREPFEQAGGLLMEYVHLLTQGRRMRDLIEDQIASLERRLAHNSSTVLGALRYIATAHRYGGYVSRTTLTRLVPVLPGGGIGQALRVLEEEFWIRDRADGRYTGLHQERSRIVSDILHEHDPIAETVERLLEDAAAGRLLNPPHPARQDIDALLAQRQVRAVSFDDWRLIDQIERERGQAVGRERIKFTHVDDMLAALAEYRSELTPG